MRNIVEALQDRLTEDEWHRTAPLRQALQACEGENIALRTTIEQLRADRAAQDARLAESERLFAEGEQRLAETERLLAERYRLLEGFRAALEIMRQSTSWRLTAPLRSVAEAISSLRTRIRQPGAFKSAPPLYGQGQR